MTCNGWILGCHANIGFLGVATYMLLGLFMCLGYEERGGCGKGRERERERRRRFSGTSSPSWKKIALRCDTVIFIFGLLDLMRITSSLYFSLSLSLYLFWTCTCFTGIRWVEAMWWMVVVVCCNVGWGDLGCDGTDQAGWGAVIKGEGSEEELARFSRKEGERSRRSRQRSKKKGRGGRRRRLVGYVSHE